MIKQKNTTVSDDLTAELNSSAVDSQSHKEENSQSKKLLSDNAGERMQHLADSALSDSLTEHAENSAAAADTDNHTDRQS